MPFHSTLYVKLSSSQTQLNWDGRVSQGQLTYKRARSPKVDLEEKDKLGQSESVAGECQWGHEKKAVHDDRRLKVMMKREALMDSRARE